MISLRLANLAAWSTLALALTLPLPAAGQGETGQLPPLTISAYDLEDGSLVLKGERTGTVEGRVTHLSTVYFTPDGTRIQEEDTRYEPTSLRLVEYVKLDHRTGRREEMRLEDGVVTLRYRESRDDDTEEDSVEWEEPMVYGYTVVPFIVKHWDTLQAGEEIEFEFLVPSRQESVGFQVRVIGEDTVDAKRVSVVQMEPSSFIIRQLVDPLKFYISLDAERVLLRYEGRSPVSRADGEPQDLRIEYRFGEIEAAALQR